MRHCDEIVVGHNLASVVYAYLNDAIIINNNPNYTPFLFDFFKPGVDLDFFMIEPSTYSMNTVDDKKQVGYPKQDLWNRLFHALSVAGKVPLSSTLQTLRIDTASNTLKAITTGGALTQLSYDKVRVFNDDSIEGLPSMSEPDSEAKKYRIFDWFDVKSGCCHEYDYLSTEDDFISEVYFYSSQRFAARNHKYKDLVAVSHMSREQISDVNYSDVSARFKILNLMRGVGIRGARNGRDQKNPERYKYYAVRIEAVERQALPTWRNKYENTSTEIFDYRSEEEVISEHIFKENQCYKTLSRLISK